MLPATQKKSKSLAVFLVLLSVAFSAIGVPGIGPVHAAGLILVSINHVPGVPKINDTVVFTGNWTSVSGTSVYNFTWKFGDGFTFSGTNLVVGSNKNVTSHQYTRAGTFPVTLTICDAGCMDKGSLTASLLVRGTLTTSFSYSPSTNYYNDNMSFTGTVANGTRTLKGTYNYTFKWDFGDGTNTVSRQSVAASLPAVLTVYHRIRASGPVSISLNINDSFGQTGSAAQTIMVGGILGIDCGYGSNEVVANSTGFPDPDGADQHGNAGTPTLDSSCTWAGGPDIPFGGTQLQPLVSDNPTTTTGPGCCSAPSRGGGFTAEVVYVQGGSSAVNAYDIIVSWNPSILDAVGFDQSGLPFNPPNSFTAPGSGINDTRGSAELSQALIGANAVGNVTLFRIRFDVVGIGSTGLTIAGESLIDPNIVPNLLPHKTLQGSFKSSNIPDFIAGIVPPATLNYAVSWTYAPSPLVPGSSVTMTATASCTGCTGPLTYKWDVDSIQGYPDPAASPATIEISGDPATITVPTATLLGHRITLIVNDTANHVAEATRRLPLTVRATATPQTVSVNTPVTLNAEWLGGIPPYTSTTGDVGVRWTLCQQTVAPQSICTTPNTTAGICNVGNCNPINGQINTVSNTYKWAGVFTGTVSITDTAVPQIPGPSIASASFQVNVTGAPQVFTVSLATNATSGSIARNNVMVNATVVYNAGYPGPARSALFSYTFIFGDGNTTRIQNMGKSLSIFHNFTSAGSYPIIVIAQEMTSLAKIQETGFSQIDVLNPISASFAPPSGTISTGQAITFTATGTGGQPPYTYAWDFGDGVTGTGASATHTYSASGTYTVKLTITDSQGRMFATTQTVSVTTSTTFYLEIGIGIGVAAVAAVAGLLLLRRRRKASIGSIHSSTTATGSK